MDEYDEQLSRMRSKVESIKEKGKAMRRIAEEIDERRRPRKFDREALRESHRHKVRAERGDRGESEAIMKARRIQEIQRRTLAEARAVDIAPDYEELPEPIYGVEEDLDDEAMVARGHDQDMYPSHARDIHERLSPISHDWREAYRQGYRRGLRSGVWLQSHHPLI